MGSALGLPGHQLIWVFPQIVTLLPTQMRG